MKEALMAMGMLVAFLVAFTEAADFSGMRGNRDLFRSEAADKASVSVDEAGTEVVAATALIMPSFMSPEEPIEVNVNRPFMFLIRDIETGVYR
jgi:serpin B